MKWVFDRWVLQSETTGKYLLDDAGEPIAAVDNWPRAHEYMYMCLQCDYKDSRYESFKYREGDNEGKETPENKAR